MATKKTPEAPKLDTENMSVWAKLLALRMEFYEAGVKKSGKNLHAEFVYFELADIVPTAEALFKKYNLLLHNTFTPERAIAVLINVDNPIETISFEIPVVTLAEPGKFRMNEIQGMGSVVTYYRRYLYQMILDLVEFDDFDRNSGKTFSDDEEVSTPAPKAPPATAEERKTIKEELTSADRLATEEETAALKDKLKMLMAADPKQEEFVQDIALRSNAFTTMKYSQYVALNEGVDAMLAALEKANE